ncbi:flagellar export protein FliJ [Lachnospiraceae bacterium 48-42]|jgi:flagellar export protein FliJ|nr:flagellar export protein FliJ [Dorea sp.]
MKKFFFPLDKVLDYKEQVLDGLKAEHARILMKVRECERAIEELEQLHRDCTAEFRKNKLNGIKISEIHTYENYLEALGVKIRIKQDQLEKLKLREEAKRNEVVEAKKETSTLDKLKEKKREEYDKEVQKEEERFIEEFVTTKSAMVRLGM